jgi:hypothetical protein
LSLFRTALSFVAPPSIFKPVFYFFSPVFAFFWPSFHLQGRLCLLQSRRGFILGRIGSLQDPPYIFRAVLALFRAPLSFVGPPSIFKAVLAF